VHVTDNSGITRGFRLPVLQAWHGVLAGGLAVLTAASVAVVVHTSDPATESTFVTAVRNAVIRLADGSESTAEVGAQLPRGAQLRTGPGGGAQLFTAGRSVYVGALSTLDVLDGVTQTLERGQVMVDARRGARLSLDTLAGRVATSAGALTRVETAAVLRLGVFEGSSTITATGRRASTAVGALHQVQVPYGYLPGQVTPLALTDDAWESRLAASLVSADQDLTRLAASLGGSDGAALLTAAPASLRSELPTAGTARGEEALSVAVAQAAGKDAASTLAEVRTARTDGGSWGVVAALVGARVSAVSALLDEALTPEAPTVAAVAPPVLDLPGLLNPRPSAIPSKAPVPTPTRPTSKPTVTPTSTPTPSSPPEVVGDLVDTVLDLLQPKLPALPPVLRPAASPSPLLGLDLHLGG
jgi:hypothetical protein